MSQTVHFFARALLERRALPVPCLADAECIQCGSLQGCTSDPLETRGEVTKALGWRV